MLNQHGHTSDRLLIPTLVAMVLTGTPASAGWPTDPATPLVIGTAEGIFGERQSVVVTDDQAVWVSWQDSFCVGSLRVQRISADGTLLTHEGIDAQEDPTCGFILPPLMLASQDAVVITRAQSTSSEHPIRSYSADGSERWVGGYALKESQALGAGTTLGNGDVLVTSSTFGGMIHVDRINTSGQRVWAGQSVFHNDAGSNFKLLACVPDATGGSFIFWDSPGPYRRIARVRRINGDGTLAWAGSVRIFGDDIFNQGSRHTPPVAIGDGLGGSVFVWSHGQETGSTPVPIKMQRIAADGTLSFPVEGARVSDGSERQFDADVERDAVTGDLLITWRDGFLEGTSVRAQRITLAGERLWGDEGVQIAVLEDMNDQFDTVWSNGQLAVAIASESGVVIHRVSADGSPVPGVWVASESGPADSPVIEPQSGGLVVSWQLDTPGTDDHLLALRFNANGLLGGPMCSPADFTGDGSLDVFDVFAFLDVFNNAEPPADFVPDGMFDVFDVFSFLDAFNAGCP